MRKFDRSQNCILIESASELPVGAIYASKLFLDFETTSFIINEYGNNPYIGHRICGIAVTYDENPDAYYIPIRHHIIGSRNIDLPNVIQWLKDVVSTCKQWINHNVKFDAHFACVETGLETLNCELIDTIVRAKLIYSDRGFKTGGYDLGSLSEDWLGIDISGYEARKDAYMKTLKKGSKDFGFVPIDILGHYACVDVLINRKLYYYCELKKEEDVKPIWNIETLLTPVLFDMERKGMKVDKTELALKELTLLTEMSKVLEDIGKLYGRGFNPNSNDQCYDLICNFYGLPVLEYTNAAKEAQLGDDYDPLVDNLEECKNPSFNKHALKQYLVHPLVVTNPKAFEAISLIQHYRQRSILLSLFVEKFQVLADKNNILHPSYNQLVRTGRMSCRNPNAQQQSKESKLLIHPHTQDHAFLSTDASQIEFRLIAHYIQDKNCIAAYNENPDTDFHTWVAEICGIPRPGGKTLNFTMAYGGGKKKVLSQLENNSDFTQPIFEEIQKKNLDVDTTRRLFAERKTLKANEAYTIYHNTLPGLQKITRNASFNLVNYGYVYNPYGRRRHLPVIAKFRAFNSVVQGFGSDIIKGAMIKMAPRYNSWTRDLGIDILMNVHDEITWHGPKDVMKDERVVSTIVRSCEIPLTKLSIPLRFSAGFSDSSWGQAGSEPTKEDKKQGISYLFNKKGYGNMEINRKNDVPVFIEEKEKYVY